LWERIGKFREKAKSSGYTVDHYSSVDELKYKVNAAINNAIKWTPAIGWVRADSISDDTDKKNEISNLNEQIAAIKKQVNVLFISYCFIHYLMMPYNAIAPALVTVAK